MTNQLGLRLLIAIEITNRRLDAALGKAGEWLTVAEAMRQYGVSRETLRRRAREGKITQGPELPVKYTRNSLDHHFCGGSRQSIPQWIAEERAR
jgi:hypothetical protein